MDPIAFVVIVPTLTLMIALIFETRQYRKLRREITNYVEVAGQFIEAFETVKGTVNFNADIQRETIEKVNTHSKTLTAIMTLLDIHDRALDLTATKDLQERMDDNILSPKKYGE